MKYIKLFEDIERENDEILTDVKEIEDLFQDIADEYFLDRDEGSLLSVGDFSIRYLQFLIDNYPNKNIYLLYHNIRDSQNAENFIKIRMFICTGTISKELLKGIENNLETFIKKLRNFGYDLEIDPFYKSPIKILRSCSYDSGIFFDLIEIKVKI